MPTFEEYEAWYEKKYHLLEPLKTLARNYQREDWLQLVKLLEDKAYADELEAYTMPLLEAFFAQLQQFKLPKGEK